MSVSSPALPGPRWLPAFVRAHPVLVGLAIVLLSRLIVFAYAYHYPITNEVGMPVSPTRLQPWIDFQFYLRSLEFYRSNGPLEMLLHFLGHYSGEVEWRFEHLVGGPIFPALIALFDYREGNTVPLASFYVLMSVALAALWLRWLAAQGVGPLGLLLFALIPNPVWFMLNVTTDLPFALLVALFLFAYRRPRWQARDVALWSLLMLACVLARPNGASIVLFVFLDLLLRVPLTRIQRLSVLVFIGGAGLAAGVYLLPYFVFEVRKVLQFYLFGLQGYDYAAGLFPGLPVWIDRPLSWLALACAKLFYFVGLRPSFAGISLELLALRSAAGLILLPGLIYLAFRGDRRDRLFAWIFFLPIFIGPTQDRYNLPIQGLLFFYGLQAYGLLWQGFQRWRGRGEEKSEAGTA